MWVASKEFTMKQLRYTVRSANEQDAHQLAKVRWQIDGETENLDREQGEAYIDEVGFRKIIAEDRESRRNLFLVAEVNEQIVGFSRCEGNLLKRMTHKVEFGVCVLKDYWGYGIGQKLLNESIQWADTNDIKKITLNVLETNEKAIRLYKNYGFEVEGILRQDKLLSDGHYYNAVVMGRLQNLML